MSGRGSRKRGRPPKTPNERTSKFNYNLLKKPKYLSKPCESQPSTPSASRASSPQESDGSRSYNRKPFTKGRGRGRKSLGNHHGNSSYSGRKGYESEYHYGSDFGDSSEKSDADDDMLISGTEDESLDAVNESESEYSVCSFSQNSVGRPPRPPSPDPIWLQGREYPELKLPNTSDDLLIGNEYVLKALSIYEVLRRFRHLVRLSPFRFEDFCAALVCDEQSALLTDTHIMLLKAILREEDIQGTHFSPLDQKDTVNISLYLIDAITWPEVLRSYVESDELFDRKVYNILCCGEYPYTGINDRITVLQFLTDQFLTTNTVRDVMLQEGPIHYDDHCRICHRLGDLLCCETCPAVYHLECVDPPLLDVPTEDWQCNLCKSHKVVGAVDCILPQEKQGVLIRHDILGLDRHGRKFWFIARRIFVEDQLTANVWYYSTTSKLQFLLSLIDKDDLEAGLYANLVDRKEEILRQLKLTETLTNEYKHHKKSSIELENESTLALLNKNDGEEMDISSKDTSDDRNIVTRQKQTQINNGTLIFKLGMENAFKSYVNQYATNPIALNKPQRNEERDKRRHLSHKFSLTTASEFKWIGITMGTSDNIITTLRQTLIGFEQNIATSFMNPNWVTLRKVWNAAVLNARKPFDFVTVLLLFQASLKNVVFANVWHEQLGHTTLRRITSTEREERKKIEKREKRERDDEEERNRLAFNYIKYSLGLKHQVWKQKGEEYRVHGQWGWMWLSSSRRCSRTRRTNLRGQILTAAKIYVHLTKGVDIDEIILVDPRTQRFMLQCEKDAQQPFDYMYLKKYKDIKVLNVDYETEYFDIVDVSKSLLMPGRLLYPKVGRRSKLDDLLRRRLDLKEAEEEMAVKTEKDDIVAKPISSQLSNNTLKYQHQTFLEKRLLLLIEFPKLHNLNSPGPNLNYDVIYSLAKKIQTVRLHFSQLNRFGKPYRCYTKECNTSSNAVAQITQNTCFSPLCLQKARAKRDLLLLLRKAHSVGNGCKETVAAILGAVKKPSILEQKLTEGKKDPSLTLDECDDLKNLGESPLDIIQDLEHARANSIPYDPKLLIECFIKNNDFISADNSNIKKESDPNTTPANITVSVDDKVDFIENLDVCSNVEVESSETTNDDSLAALVSNNDDSEALLQRKNRKYQKTRNKSYIATKDVLSQTLEKEVPNGKHNRRFPAHPRLAKRDDIKYEKEFYPNDTERIYAATSPRGRIYLLRNAKKLLAIKQGKDKSETNTTYSKYPLISHFSTHKLKKSLLVLPSFELQKLARVGGKISASGFHHLAKNNNTVWPYPCSRPLFKTCWSFRTVHASTLSAVALQLRILWSCLRWDDMIAKAPSTDGKHQVSTETEVVTQELLKFRNMGRYGERTQYLRRKVVVPLEVPKTIREVTSIRSGLRKRKRAESPQPTEPQISEEWVEEDKLELWEIKFIGEKQEKSKFVTLTRSGALRQAESHPTSSNTPSASNGNISKNIIVKAGEDMKEKMEQQLKLQRAAQQQKKLPETSTKTGLQVKGQIIGSRRVIVKNPDGTTRIIQQSITTPTQKTNASSAASSVMNTNQSLTPAQTQQNISQPQTAAGSSTSTPQQHKVQIIRGPDGKVSVRGLNPGQQLIQMPDGKLHVLTTTTLPQSNNKTKLPVKPPTSQASSSSVVKQITVKQVNKPTIQATQKVSAQVIQPAKPQQTKVITQIQNQSATISQNVNKIVSNVTQMVPSNTTKMLNNAQNIQQLIVQPGQKLLVGQNAQGQKVIISSGQQNTTLSGQQQQQQQQQNQSTTNLQSLQTQVQPTPQQQQQPQVLVNQVASNQQSTQKVIQQIVNTSNVQQQIMVGGQRIILSPGQTIVTQRSLPQNQQVQVVSPQQIIQPSSQQQSTPTQVILQSTQQAATISNQQQQQTKAVKHVVVQQPTPTISEHTTQNMKSQQSNVASVSTNQQIIVQNSTLAQQLAQGKLQVATINGQQVIIKPLGNNQAQIVAHIKTQSDGNAHIVTNSILENQTASPVKTNAPVIQAQKQQLHRTPPQAIQQQVVQQQVNTMPVQNQPPAFLSQQETQIQQQPSQSTVQVKQPMSIEESLLQGQPPGTVIKCVTAQVIQTEQGPRIVLQGLVGNDFTQQQLALVQQQVKQQLLKAQESSGKQGVLGPTKIYLAVQPSTAVLNSQPPPLTPVHQSSHQQASHLTKPSTERNNTVEQQSYQNEVIDTAKVQSSQCNTHDQIGKDIQSPDFVVAEGYTQQTTENAFKEDIESDNETNQQNHNLQQESFLEQSVVNASTNSPNKRFSHKLNDGDIPTVNIKQKYDSSVLHKMRDNGTRLNVKTHVIGVAGNNFSLNSTLQRHKDLLKKNILKKRSLLERNLQNEIKEEMTTKVVTKALEKSESLKKLPKSTSLNIDTTKRQVKHSAIIPYDSSDKNQQQKIRKVSKKREKLYCICRTPYDDTKFYVGCDLCSNWFHGDCVNITEEASKKLSEFICEDCKRARETQELYCSCRQPYDESQFYICCDKCQDWFHGRCVGIVQSEAEFIDEYVCPECQRNSSVNNANTKNLTDNEIIELKKLIKQIQMHKSAWPFMEPVDPDEAPDYYKVIKEPMDLQKIETKLNTNAFTKLSEFIGDMTKIFDNCRYYNPKESSFYKCAETLESYFVQRIKNFRENVVGNN